MRAEDVRRRPRSTGPAHGSVELELAAWHDGCTLAWVKETNTMNRKTSAATLAFTTLAAVAPVQAGVQIDLRIGNDRADYRDRGRYNAGRIAFDNGYRDGLREGEKDDRRDDRYNYRDERRYREADAGYRREFGNRYEYAAAYRRGFESGYRQGYANRRHDRRFWR